MQIKSYFKTFQKMIGLVGSAITLLAGNHEAGISPPDIKISSWVDGENGRWKNEVWKDLDDEGPVTLVKDKYNVYIATSQVLLITFLCSAPYPLEWNFSHAKWLLSHDNTLGVYLTTSRRNSDDIDNPKTFTYYSQITFFGDPKLYDGTYVCKSALDNDPSKRNNFTLYWEGGPFENPFVLSDRNVTIWIDKSDKIIFPCHVTNPFVDVSLLQQQIVINNQGQNEETWYVVPLSSKLKYQPDLGFIYERTTLRDNWLDPGVYKCVTGTGNDTDSDFVLINLIASIEPEFQLDFPITTNASLKQIKNPGMGVECCSSSATPPRISLYPCGNPSECKQIYVGLQNEVQNEEVDKLIRRNRRGNMRTNGSCVTSFIFWVASADVTVVRCVGDGINVTRTFWTSKNPQNISSHYNWDKESLEKWIEIEPKPLRWSKTTPNNNPVGPPKKIPSDTKDDMYLAYVGQSIDFDCKAPMYFFSYGVRSIVNYKDGTTEVQPDYFSSKGRYKLPFDFLQQITPLVTVLTVQNVTKEMASLTCLVPVSNSSEWIKKTVLLSVKEPALPTIEITDMENVFWNVNETDRKLECKTSGDPEPLLIWIKDNKIQLGSQFNVSKHHDGTHTLHIPLVTHDIQGEFKCVSVNFAGRIEKVFNVYVEESHAIALTTTILVMLFIILLLAGAFFIVRKTLLQKSSLDNLREYVYNNGEQGNNANN